MRVVFIGTGEIGAPVLESLLNAKAHELVGVVTQPDKPVGRQQRIEPTAIKAALGENMVPLLQPPKIKAPEAITAIAGMTPDLIVVMAYGQILPRALLEIPRVACLNLHASLLPKHRGASPIQAAIVAGDTETGITVMHMAEGLDTGDMVLQLPLAIQPDETGRSLHDRLSRIAPEALERALDHLARGDAGRTSQDDAAATYAPKLEREHGRIDWREPAVMIERKIRAFDPWPGAFTRVRDGNGREMKLKIFRARLAAGGEPPLLSCFTGEQRLEILEAQLEGKRRMSADELLRGNAWLAGAIGG